MRSCGESHAAEELCAAKELREAEEHCAEEEFPDTKEFREVKDFFVKVLPDTVPGWDKAPKPEAAWLPDDKEKCTVDDARLPVDEV